MRIRSRLWLFATFAHFFWAGIDYQKNDAGGVIVALVFAIIFFAWSLEESGEKAEKSGETHGKP